MLTYGDGLANINLNNLVKFHKNHTKMVTITAVRPSARFGELNLDPNNAVTSFKEKPQIKDGWVNGGFFVLNKDFLNYIDDESTILEKEPLERMVAQKDIAAYQHEGFWQCMDTKRDKDYLNQLWDTKKAFWVQNND
jgi:glucose-1-phosphate cytidylyltransferase